MSNVVELSQVIVIDSLRTIRERVLNHLDHSASEYDWPVERPILSHLRYETLNGNTE
jgi:hypothetical protein